MSKASLNEKDVEVLRKSALCGAMSDAEMAEVLATGTIATLAQHDYLFEQCAPARNLFIILDGWCQITRDEIDGSRTLIATFHEGNSLAEAAAFLRKPYPASAQAMTDLRVLSVNGEMLLDIMLKNRDVLARSLASIFHKLHDLVDDVEWLKSRTIRERLAKFLLEQSQEANGSLEFRLPYAKSMIAAKIGTSPQQLSRTFLQLQEFGVQINGQTAVIEDPDTLRAMIERS